MRCRNIRLKYSIHKFGILTNLEKKKNNSSDNKDISKMKFQNFRFTSLILKSLQISLLFLMLSKVRAILLNVAVINQAEEADKQNRVGEKKKKSNTKTGDFALYRVIRLTEWRRLIYYLI